jgi:hypothetical protein
LTLQFDETVAGLKIPHRDGQEGLQPCKEHTLVLLPILSQTTCGPVMERSERSAKSSSFVTTAQLPFWAKAQIAVSSASSRPASRAALDS